MSIIDNALEANRNYAKKPDPKRAQPPAPKIVVVVCMDPRLSNLPEILGLPELDIDVIRTAGPAVTDDVIAEIIVSNRVLGSKEIMLLNHTGCGFTTFTDAELNAKLAATTGALVARSDALLRLQRPCAAHSRTDQEGQIPSLGSRRRSLCGALYSTCRQVS